MNRLSPGIFLFLFVIGLSCQVGWSQSVQGEFQNSIEATSKPLQFGSDFLTQPSITSIDFREDQEYLTAFSKEYHQNFLTYDPIRDPKRLLINTGMFLGATVVSFGILWVLPESFTNWDKEQIKEEGLFTRWKENVRAGPVWDKDDFFLNWIMHPWSGAVYYMTARGSGYKMWESFTYSFVMSTFFWEYGVEAFAEIPSWQDLIITPTLGSVLGEFFFKWKGNIVGNNREVLNSRFLGGTCLLVMDPFNEILDKFGYETKHKIQTYSAITPIQYDFVSNRTIWGLSVYMNF